MSALLWIREDYVNTTRGLRFGESDWTETRYSNLGDLYRSLRSEYGRATAMYRDGKDGKVIKVGWVFTKRMTFDDARVPRGEKPKRDQTYIREVWVEVSTEPPARITSIGPVSPWG